MNDQWFPKNPRCLRRVLQTAHTVTNGYPERLHSSGVKTKGSRTRCRQGVCGPLIGSTPVGSSETRNCCSATSRFKSVPAVPWCAYHKASLGCIMAHVSLNQSRIYFWKLLKNCYWIKTKISVSVVYLVLVFTINAN